MKQPKWALIWRVYKKNGIMPLLGGRFALKKKARFLRAVIFL
jgi:hypothetical protein